MHSAQINSEYTIREVRLKDAFTIWKAIHRHKDYLKTWLSFATDLTLADEQEFLSSVLNIPYERRNIIFKIQKKRTFCGLIGFVNTDFDNHRTEIGYWLLPAHQKKGIMTQSVKHLCRWAVKEREMNRIQIRCAVDNRPSNAIPRRLGFTLEGIEREGELLSSGQYTDIHVYSILKDEVDTWKKEDNKLNTEKYLFPDPVYK